MQKSSLLLLFGQSDMPGWYPVKFFDYLSVQKPILLSPSDNDVLAKSIEETHSGFVLNTVEEIVSLLNDLYTKWENKTPVAISSDKNCVMKFSRENQTRELAKIIDKILDTKVD